MELMLPWKSAQAAPVRFDPVSSSKGAGFAQAGVLKDGGDDPDATDGMEIRATVSFSQDGSVKISGGEGVGRVTRPGLAPAVGQAAINPVPLAMIEAAAAEALAEAGAAGRGLEIVISAPEGTERALKTMNARLGIVGGISILGSTGIVIPMSTSAWTGTIDACLDIAKASGAKRALLAFGRTSERAGQTLYPELAGNAAVLMGDHVGYSLDAAVKRDLDVVIAGQFAKFCKLASGSYKTHVRDSTLDMNLLARLMNKAGFPREEAQRALAANTAREVYEALRATGDRGVFSLLTEETAAQAFSRAQGKISVEAALFGYSGELIVRTRLERKGGEP